VSGRAGTLGGSGKPGNSFAQKIIHYGGWESYRANNQWQCAGSINSFFAVSLTNITFDTFLFAYPLGVPRKGTITNLAFYLNGDATCKGWAGVFSNTRDANGNPFPSKRLGFFESIPGSADGHLLRQGVVSVAAGAGSLLWLVTQVSATSGAAGLSASTLIAPLGFNLLAAAATTTQSRWAGWRTSAAAAYDSTLTTFPTAGVELLNCNTGLPNPILIGGGNSAQLPFVYFKFASDAIDRP
jgi:hypothetical protein